MSEKQPIADKPPEEERPEEGVQAAQPSTSGNDPWGRAAWAIALAILIALLELVLGVLVYLHISWMGLAVLAAAIGVVAFALIDMVIRPRYEPQGSRHVRSLLPFWSLVPSFCVLGSATWMHVQQWNAGLDDIEQVATELEQAICIPDSCPNWDNIWTKDIEAKIDEIMAKRFPGEALKSDEAHQFDELARVVGHDLKRANGNLDDLMEKARLDTAGSFALAIAIQTLFVLWIPILLALAILKAHKTLAARGRADYAKRKDPQFQQFKDLRESMNLRDMRILGEERAFFLPRLCFGALLVLGTNYVFAPFGLKASYIMSLVDEHALPGHTSYTLWSTSFSAAPVIVVGFVGFLIYALITATQRFMQDDLDDQAVLSLLVRGLVVILLSLALSSSPINDTAARMFVFIAGVFPVRALEAIAKKANVAIDPDLDSNAPGSFEGLPSLDPTKVFVLRAAGILSTYDLAAMPIEEIAKRVRIDPRLLGRAVDRAILIDALGLQLAKDLEPFAITSATELVLLFKDKIPDAVLAKFGDVPSRVAQRLAGDARVVKVESWLAGTAQV